MQLNRTGTQFNREERNKLNDNWKTIENNYNNVVDEVSNEAYEQVVDAAKLTWQEPVATFDDISAAYPEPSEGDTVMARDTGKVYRYNGSDWQEIQQIDAGPVNEVDNRLNTKINENYNEVSSQLAQTVTGVVNTNLQFGAVGDGVTDDTEAIQNALDAGGEVRLTGTLLVTKTLKFTKDSTYLIGNGLPTLIWGGEPGGTLLEVKSSAIGKVFEDVQIKNIYFNGANKTKWLLDADGFSFDCLAENLHFSRSVGSINANSCFYSSWDKIYVWSQVDGVPDGMSVSEWADVHNNNYSAPISFKQAHSAKISNLHVGTIGTSANNIPEGRNRTRTALRVEGFSTSVSDISFEGTRGKDEKETALDAVMTLSYGTNISINNVYMEAVHSEYVFHLLEYVIGLTTIEHVYYEKSSFKHSFVRSYFQNDGIILKGVTGLEVDMPVEGQVLSTRSSNPATLQNINFREGSVYDYDGGKYDTPEPGKMGVIGTNARKDYPIRPSVRRGLNVKYAGNRVFVDLGVLENAYGDLINVGQKSLAYIEKEYDVGKSFIINEAGEWNLCVDNYGMVFIEDVNNQRLNHKNSKLILAVFSTSDTGTIETFETKTTSIGDRGGALVSLLWGTTHSVASGDSTAIEFDNIEYGGSSIFGTSEPSRLYVPNGVENVRLSGNVHISGLGTARVYIYKNGETFPGVPVLLSKIENPTFLNVTTPVLNVQSGDYFELIVENDGDNTLNIGGPNTNNTNATWFSLEVL